MSEKYCYSTDGGEYFIGEYDTPESAAENAFNDIADIDQVEIGRIVRKTAHDFVDVEGLLENLQDNAGDECGECSADWLNDLLKDQAKKDELKSLIGDWVERNDQVKFNLVDDIVQTTREEVEAGRFVYGGF